MLNESLCSVSMMNYFTIAPPASLSKFVRCFWVLESTLPSYTHRSMADVCCEMVFHYQGQFNEIIGQQSELASLTAIHGPSDQIRRFAIDSPFAMFGVYFYPFAIPVIFGVPSSELCNQMPDLSTFINIEGRVLEDQMIAAKDNYQRVKIITQYLESKLAKRQLPQHRVFSSIHSIIQNNGRSKIDQLADQHFLSKRQFERAFKQYAGLTPKLFSGGSFAFILPASTSEQVTNHLLRSLMNAVTTINHILYMISNSSRAIIQKHFSLVRPRVRNGETNKRH